MSKFTSDMRIRSFGSGGKILNLDWFLNYGDTKLVIQSTETEGRDVLSAFCKHLGFFRFWAASSNYKLLNVAGVICMTD